MILHCGDCLEILPMLDENSIDACVTDPPYHLTSIVKRFGADNAAPAQFGTDGAYARASRGFMGKQWDGGDIAFRPETWAAVYEGFRAVLIEREHEYQDDIRRRMDAPQPAQASLI